MTRARAALFCLVVACLPAPAWAQAAPECPYLPAFEALARQIPSLAPDAALTALERYSLSNENPVACESIEIASLMSDQERRLVFLKSGGALVPAQASYRCSRLTGATLGCNGAVADGTSMPLSAGIKPLDRPVRPRVAIVSETGRLTLRGAFTISLSRLVDGHPPTKLPHRGGEVATRSFSAGSVLIAIFKGADPWRYRKLVWYF